MRDTNDNFCCPYCHNYIPAEEPYTKYVGIHPQAFPDSFADSILPDDITIGVIYYFCHHCHQISVQVVGMGSLVEEINDFVKPLSDAQMFPDYVPASIRTDYLEAKAILFKSPKASATLARRCLQGMIRDHFKVKEKNLYQEIDAIKPLIPVADWDAIDALRKIGNIGAHMEKDVNLIIDIDPNEAYILTRLVEDLITRWYVEEHNHHKICADVISIYHKKEALRLQAAIEGTDKV